MGTGARWSVFALLVLRSSTVIAQDTIEFLSGATSTGKVVAIHKADREVVFAAKIANLTTQRVYPYARIHAITYRGKRYVLNETKEDAGREPAKRSPSEIEELIEKEGRTSPAWLDNTPLEYPDTLDLQWPQPAPQPWNNQKNVGQYIWDRINPNEGKWRSGIKLLYHLLAIHSGDEKKTRQVMRALGGMYFRFYQDSLRAAYWWRQARVPPRSADGVNLAECYYRLGSKRMALDWLDTRQPRVQSIKLLGTMGETREALQMAEAYARAAKEPQWALLTAGDACRADKQYDKAIAYYRRVLDATDMRNEQYDQRARNRAEQSIAAIRQFELLDIAQIDNGKYEAETLAYEGPLAVMVTVEDGKLLDVQVTRHKEKQYYSALRDMPAQIIAKQSVKDVDATSGATITAEAIVAATAKALVRDATQ